MENQKKIRVGIIGVSTNRGWAAMGHIPALKSLPPYHITALSATNKEKAQAAGKAFDIEHTFDNNDDLVNSPEVDLVVITVKVPNHQELVNKAIEAGKMVYCEWPLGNGLQEALSMQQLAAKKNVRAITGLQTQSVPAIRYIKALIESGSIGKVLSTSVIGAIGQSKIDEDSVYLVDKKNGANMFTITLGSALHALCYCLGEFKNLSATTAVQTKSIKVEGTDRFAEVDTEDQIVVNGLLQNEAVISVHYKTLDTKGTSFLWEINGTEGDIVITAAGSHLAFFPLTIQIAAKKDKALSDLPVPSEYYLADEKLSGSPAYNVAQHYIHLAQDISDGTNLCTTFGDAVIRHQMINAIEIAAATGSRQSYIV